LRREKRKRKGRKGDRQKMLPASSSFVVEKGEGKAKKAIANHSSI
jgi:hypothetical protein